jgi:hypothetical protein
VNRSVGAHGRTVDDTGLLGDRGLPGDRARRVADMTKAAPPKSVEGPFRDATSQPGRTVPAAGAGGGCVGSEAAGRGGARRFGPAWPDRMRVFASAGRTSPISRDFRTPFARHIRRVPSGQRSAGESAEGRGGRATSPAYPTGSYPPARCAAARRAGAGGPPWARHGRIAAGGGSSGADACRTKASAVARRAAFVGAITPFRKTSPDATACAGSSPRSQRGARRVPGLGSPSTS